MATFTSDTFTGTDGTSLSSRAGETGATWTNQNAGAEAVLNTNRVAGNSTSATTVYYASGVPVNADYDVQADLIRVGSSGGAGTAGVGVTGRHDTAAATFYHARWEQSTAQWALYASVAGTFSPVLGVSATNPLTAGLTRTVKLEMRGPAIKVFVDGTQVISVTNSDVTAAGRAGLRWFRPGTASAGYLVDNLTAADPAAAGVELAGTSAGSSTTTGALNVTAALGATSAGTSSTTAALNQTAALQATSAGGSTTSAGLTYTAALQATSAGSSTTTGDATATFVLAATSAGSSTTTGGLAGPVSLAATSTGSSSTAGSVDVVLALAATSTATSITTGDLAATRGLNALSAGASTTTGTVAATVGLAATTAGGSTTTGAAVVAYQLDGVSAGVGASTGVLDVRLAPIAHLEGGSGATFTEAASAATTPEAATGVIATTE